MLLIGLALSWFIHMLLVETYGSVYFVEEEPVILWTEITMTAAILVFGAVVLVTQIKRLGEKRENDRVAESAESDRTKKT